MTKMVWSAVAVAVRFAISTQSAVRSTRAQLPRVILNSSAAPSVEEMVIRACVALSRVIGVAPGSQFWKLPAK